jgi:hypothetical protein
LRGRIRAASGWFLVSEPDVGNKEMVSSRLRMAKSSNFQAYLGLASQMQCAPLHLEHSKSFLVSTMVVW